MLMFQVGMDDFVTTKLIEWQLPGLMERFRGKLIYKSSTCLHFIDTVLWQPL